MKIYLVDNTKITKFVLPSKSDDFFSYTYTIPGTSNTCLITFEKVNDKWMLKSNGVVNVCRDGYSIDSVEIVYYEIYKLKILGNNDFVNLWIFPIDEQVYKLDISPLNEVNIGSNQNCKICYYGNEVAPIHCVIKKDANGWLLNAIEDPNYSVYVNGHRVFKKRIKTGDIIFINGFKLVWMNRFIIINNPNNLINVIGIQPYIEPTVMDNTNFDLVNEEDKSVDLYKESDYFYHTPRIQEIVEETEIEIEAPPQSEVKEELPWLLSIGSSVTMAASSLMMGWNVGSGLISGNRTILDVLPQIVMCLAMIFGSLIMPRVISSYQKKLAKAKEEKRITKFNAYLDEKEKNIQLILKKQAQIMRDNSLSAANCKAIALSSNNRNFWSREITDEDFLSIRLGIGCIDAPIRINAPKERFTLEEDGLLERVLAIAEKYKKLDNVPINISLLEKNISAFICSDKIIDLYLNSILLQLITLHSGADLKLVIFTNETNSYKWEFAKFLPHCWNEDKTVRFFATTNEEAKYISNTLEEEFKNRKAALEGKSKDDYSNIKREDEYKNFETYYLIICDNYKNNLGIPIIDNILKNKDINYGFSFTIFTNTLKNLPAQCNTFIEIGDKDGCILERNISSKNQQFLIEYDSSIDLRAISNGLLNIPILSKEGLAVLPTSLSFLDMYGVSKIEQLNILNRWKTNNPVTSLSAPIGVHASGEQFKLNLHEKFHGPHGLIAGSTGSGKSEFIITYILSMCINYHPYEVQFVLIDYKGGGLAGAFQNKETGVKIPHLVGTITNLDTSEMNRTLVSINSELKRRQRIFNETKDLLGESTIDIYKYQKFYREGAVKKPMAHLFIISDEFAELKAQQPEFMQELISTSRIGRSLGVHLILATQKPSGVVNDQIWSNSKFKVCLKVQDRGDSMEMLKRPDAASIKEAGRFYLQVGYDDFFDKGQSGWAGAKYVPSDTILKKVDDSIEFINNVGEVTHSIKDVQKVQVDTTNYGDQLTNIVKNIYNLGNKENIITNSLWLDSIPEQIFINDLKTKYSYKPTPYVINPLIGEYDKPAAQEQGPLNVNLTDGNLIIWGQGGSGKENLLSTIIWSTCIEHTPQEVNFYIIDCGSEALRMFHSMPHVGDIATLEDTEKIINTLVMVEEELQYRKDIMADYGGSYKEYIKNSGKKIPLLVTIINSYEIFSETYARLAESIQTFFRDGSKYGIIFIVSAISTNGVRARSVQNFSNKICLKIPNEQEYRSVVNAPRGLLPAKVFGRGLVARDSSAVEFQTALFCQRKDMVKVVKSASEQFNAAYKYKAKKIAVVPNVVYANTLLDQVSGIDDMPIGIGIDSKEPFKYDFTARKITTILASKFNMEKLSFVKTFIDFAKSINNININIIDLSQTFEGVFNDIKYYSNDFDNAMIDINNFIMTNKESKKKTFNILVGAGLLKTKLNEQGKAIVNNIFTNLPNLSNTYFILIDSYSSFRNLQTEIWYQSNADNTSGIWLGEEVNNQMAININDLSLEDRKKSFPYMAFAVNKGQYTIIKHVVEDEEGNNE